MFPFSSLIAVSVISDLPLEVTTCKFRILDEGEVSRVIKRFVRIGSEHERILAFSKGPILRGALGVWVSAVGILALVYRRFPRASSIILWRE